MSEWQPIESAPKDGTKILGWGPEWDAAMTIMYRNNSWRDALCGALEIGDWGQPTHWMPLPKPPKE